MMMEVVRQYLRKRRLVCEVEEVRSMSPESKQNSVELYLDLSEALSASLRIIERGCDELQFESRISFRLRDRL